jgi:formylglycine-generating enzyme required for sulfatase activity
VQDAKSGTEHEFLRANEAWKQTGRPQIMVYFNQRAYAPRTKEETDQWGQVLEFQRNFPKEGLWWPYRGRAEFERLVRRHLTQFILQHTPQPAPKPNPMSGRQPFEPEMILIPAGEFLMGSDPQHDEDAQDNEQPQHCLYLPDYYLAKTPVTMAQYRAFVLASGHEAPYGWTDRAPPGGEGDHPIANVTWYDARAYCQWLSEVTGRGYGLPSEAEWEKGARGTDGRIYPWGNCWVTRHGNSAESGLKKTTSVHAYPRGASPYGVLDLAGNVWEWTRSLWGQRAIEPSYRYPYKPTDGRENLYAGHEVERVLRGGSFDATFPGARCAHRLGGPPLNGARFIGIRVVMHP